MKPSRLEISLPVLQANCRALRRFLPSGTALCAVIKADGYGHGLLQSAAAFAQGGADCVAVARCAEGVVLREGGFAGRIIVLGPPDDAAAAVAHELESMIATPAHIRQLAAAAQAFRRVARVHVKLDTGMSRLGARTTEEVTALAQALAEERFVTVAAVFSHLACADAPDDEPIKRQLARFHALTAPLDARGLAPLCHIANSAAMLRNSDCLLGMVRPGLAMYGCAPSPQIPLPDGIGPAMRWVAPIERLQWVPAGTEISYGARHVTQRETLLATVGIGYGDGYHRAVGRGCVLIGGQRAPVLGAVCMDHLMADVTDIAARGADIGEEAVLLGEQQGAVLTADDLAEAWGTIPYEVMLARLPRVQRVYTRDALWDSQA